MSGAISGFCPPAISSHVATLMRATFLVCLAALELDGVALEEI
jgi:hypothetical protein